MVTSSRPGSTWRSSRCFVRSEASTRTDAPSRASVVAAFHQRHVKHGLLGRLQDSRESSRPGSTWRPSRCFVRSEPSTRTNNPSRASVVTTFHQRHVKHGLRGWHQDSSDPESYPGLLPTHKKSREAEGFSGLAANQSLVEGCQFGSIH